MTTFTELSGSSRLTKEILAAAAASRMTMLMNHLSREMLPSSEVKVAKLGT